MIKKRAIGFLMSALCFVSAFPVNASAASGNSIILNYEQNLAAFEIYHVATLNAENQYVMTPAFKESAVDTSDWRLAANTLDAFINQKKIKNDAATQIKNNKASFQNLSDGLYLIRGEKTSSGAKTYTPNPFLIYVSQNGTISATVKYEVSSSSNGDSDSDGSNGGGSGNPSAKPDKPSIPEPPTTPNRTDYTVRKIWKDDFAENRPTSVTVQLLCNGTQYGGEITLSENNHWQYIWSNLDAEKNWQVVETNVPAGYLVSVEDEKHTFTVTNTYQKGSTGNPSGTDNNIPAGNMTDHNRSENAQNPSSNNADSSTPSTPSDDSPSISDDTPPSKSNSNTDDPSNTTHNKLPQTGQNWLSVLVLTVLGSGSLFTYFIIRKKHNGK